METSLLSQAETIKETGAMWGSAGDGRVGMVAADDAAAAAVALFTGDPGPERSYEVTGPEAVTMAEAARRLSEVLGRTVAYNDLSEDAFREMLMQEAGMMPEQAEIGVLAHCRAWRRGDADLVTDTVAELTGHPAISLEQWLRQHKAAFA